MKRGQTAPWQVRFQYDGQPAHKNAEPTRDTARLHGQQIADRGATVSIWVRNDVTGKHEHFEDVVGNSTRDEDW